MDSPCYIATTEKLLAEVESEGCLKPAFCDARPFQIAGLRISSTIATTCLHAGSQ
jgi:hypothetical protein